MKTTDKKSNGYRMPAEWEPHEATWVAWPCHVGLWKGDLPAARAAFTDMCRAIAPGERMEVMIFPRSRRTAEQTLEGLNVNFHEIPYGDIWLRDTGPIFIENGILGRIVVDFSFNGWGQKFDLPHDKHVSDEIARCYLFRRSRSFVLEGGSIDVDGQGTALTTEECLLNPNRDFSRRTRKYVEGVLHEMLGIEHVIWLKRGLVNDHTDGHIDNIARFVAPGVVLCMEHRKPYDPNRDIFDAVIKTLKAARDGHGRKLEIMTVPSPCRVEIDGEVAAASHLNFYISNSAVIVPTYGTRWDEEVLKRLEPIFPGRKVVGIDANAILTGGGAFHCITQQVPAIGGKS